MRSHAMNTERAELTASALFDQVSQGIVEERLRDTGLLEPCDATNQTLQRETVAMVSATGVRPLDLKTQADARLLQDIDHETQEILKQEERLDELRAQEDARQDDWARLPAGMTGVKRALAVFAQLVITFCALMAAIQLLPVTLAELVFLDVAGNFRNAVDMGTSAAWAMAIGLLAPLAVGMILVGGRAPVWLKIASIFIGDAIFCAALSLMRIQLAGEEHRSTAIALGLLEFAIAFVHGSVTWLVAQWCEEQLKQAEAKRSAQGLLDATRQALARVEKLRTQAQNRLNPLLELLARREDEPYRLKMQAELAAATAQSVYLSVVERNRYAEMGELPPAPTRSEPVAMLPAGEAAATAQPALPQPLPWWRRLLDAPKKQAALPAPTSAQATP